MLQDIRLQVNTLRNTITGSTGNGILTGSGDADRLTGNAGKDLFVFKPTIDWRDTITDFYIFRSSKILKILPSLVILGTTLLELTRGKAFQPILHLFARISPQTQ